MFHVLHFVSSSPPWYYDSCSLPTWITAEEGVTLWTKLVTFERLSVLSWVPSIEPKGLSKSATRIIWNIYKMNYFLEHCIIWAQLWSNRNSNWTACIVLIEGTWRIMGSCGKMWQKLRRRAKDMQKLPDDFVVFSRNFFALLKHGFIINFVELLAAFVQICAEIWAPNLS